MAFTAKDVQALREKTGVGMMDCKKALTATDGDMDKAIEFLREKGMATAVKRAGKIASEGIVELYNHMNGKIGVMVEINCETDFVANSDKFRALAHELCLQIAAAKPLYVNKEEVPESELEHEREILKAQALNEGKPAAIVEKMTAGRIQKYYKEVCLLEQDYVKNPDKTVTQLINEAVGTIGEKINVRRFARFEMGEGLEKKSENFADEISAEVAKVQSKVGQ
jgi:elongation factor Ts